MALNLSRNTKVFVSSVNGIPTAGGGILTAYVSTKGTGYAVGDIVTLGTTSGSGANAKCIVLSISGSGAVESVAIPLILPDSEKLSIFKLNEAESIGISLSDVLVIVPVTNLFISCNSLGTNYFSPIACYTIYNI